jgi:hypothetical protein
MTRKKSTDETLALIEFANAALVASESLGIKKNLIDDFPLERPERLLAAKLGSLPVGLKKKLGKNDAEFTIADAARILIAVAKSLPICTSLQVFNLLLVSKKLAESLRSNIRPALPAKARRSKTAEAVFQFKITLLGSKPPIWRRIHVRDCTLDELHEHIQTAMGWTNSHLHHFKLGEQLYGDPDLIQENFAEFDYEDSTKTMLSDLIPTKVKAFRFVYEYDFGDSWNHEVLFEGRKPIEPETKYPLCLDGKRASPPEDVGGIWGYPDFLEAIRDPENERHEELQDWSGGSFDPEEFDPKKATKAMRKGLPDWRE